MTPTMRVISSPSAWLERAFAELDEDVILTSPHCVFGFAHRIAEAAAGSDHTWAVVTTIDPAAVTRGYLSIEGLQLLLDADVQIQHVDRLHTHCLFVGHRALLGAASLGMAELGATYLGDEDDSDSSDGGEQGDDDGTDDAHLPMELAVELTDEQLAEAWARIARRRSVVVDARDLDWLRAQVRET